MRSGSARVRRRLTGAAAAGLLGVGLAIFVAGARATHGENVFAGQWSTNTGSIRYSVADPASGAQQLVAQGGQACASPTVYYVGTYSDPGPRTGVVSGCTVGGPNHLVGRFVGDASTDRGSAGDINITFVAPASFSGYSTNVNSPGGPGQQFSYTGSFQTHFTGDGCCPAPPPTTTTTPPTTTTTAPPAAGDVFNINVLPLFPILGVQSGGKVADFQSSSGSGTYSASIDWGDGTPPSAGQVFAPIRSGRAFTRAVAGTHTYAANGTYTVTVTVTDPAGHARSGANQATVTACFCTTRPPVLAKTVDVGPVSGQIFVKLPAPTARAGAAHAAAKGTGFVPLTEAREIPVGSTLDTRQGKLVVMAATATAGQLSGGAFSGGIFQLLQRRREVGLTDLRLGSAAVRVCKPTGKARTAAARPLSKRVLGLLHASVSGRFRTTGRSSAATVRGTEWTTTDRCDGTLTQVTRGAVTVFDYRARRNVVVTAGRSYLARAR